MRLLLDTHVYLWFLADSPKLSKTARARIADADTVYVSAVSIWEAAIKIGIGTLSANPDGLLAGIEASGFVELPVLARHAAGISALPNHHRDPFDRLLVAQAICEPLRLLTADKALTKYTELAEVV